MIAKFEATTRDREIKAADITSLVHLEDVGPVRDAVLGYLLKSEEVWILFDNIDKGWPARGTKAEDVTLVRCLLEASRKIQRMFGARGQEAHSTVFLRKDVYDLLVDLTPDRGKEAAVNLDWSDVELVKSLIARRIRSSTRLEGDFDTIWMQVFDPHVRGTDSFRYILDRTFMRPRDVLNFSRLAIQVAISRDHERVEEEDVLLAERSFSEDMLNDLRHEIRDVFPTYPDVLNGFNRSKRVLSDEDLLLTLMCADATETDIDKVIDALLWFSFIGVTHGDDEAYSYQFMYNLERLKSLSENPQRRQFTIHPAFHAALDVQA